MKFLFAFLLVLVITPIFAEPVLDRPGLKTRFSVPVGPESYVIESTANFDMRNVIFQDNKFVFSINSSIENNFAEIQIPNAVTSGDLRFSLDGKQISPNVLQNQKISFVTLEFTGNGTHTLEVTSDFVPKSENKVIAEQKPDNLSVIFAAVGIVLAGGVASTLAVYVKRKRN